MCVFVAYAMLQLLRTAVMAVLQVRRNGTNPNIPHIAQRLVNPKIGGIAFRRTGNVCHRLRQGNPPLRHPDKIDRLHGRNRHLQSVRICIAHILRCTDDNSPRNKFRVFPCINHFRQIIQSRIGVRAAHALDERGNRIIMVVPILIIIQRALLDALLRLLQGDVNRFVRLWLRCQHCQF